MTKLLLQKSLTESEMTMLAAALAGLLVGGECIALHGELGAGKTTFARALIRALLNDPLHEVPSPTFSLRQDYSGRCGPIVHFDLYRLVVPEELDELDFDDAVGAAITIIEWPERASDRLPLNRVEIALSESDAPDKRQISLSGRGSACETAACLARNYGHR